jgi:hypothetical protein
MLFITEYAVVGSRCNGTYLVNAETKKQASEIVKKIDPDYVICQTYTEAEYNKYVFELMVEGVQVPALGQAALLESGT